MKPSLRTQSSRLRCIATSKFNGWCRLQRMHNVDTVRYYLKRQFGTDFTKYCSPSPSYLKRDEADEAFVCRQMDERTVQDHRS